MKQEKKELTYEQQRELAWKLHQELLEAIPGEPKLSEVDSIIDDMKGFIYARAIVPGQ